MAIRIYDQTVGQLAGVVITTTGKGRITNDGLEAYAQLVGVVDSGGDQVDLATEATLELVQTDTAATSSALGTTGDSPWTSGAGSVISLLKPIASAALSTDAAPTFPFPADPVSGLTAAMTGTTSTAVTGVGAGGANVHNYITAISVGNSHASVGTFVEFQDGSGGTTFFTVPAAAVYGGATISFPTPLKQPTANTALYVKNTTTGANVIVSVVGFQA